MATIVSPKSGRLIKVGGKAYNDLLKDPKYRGTALNPASSPEARKLGKASLEPAGKASPGRRRRVSSRSRARRSSQETRKTPQRSRRMSRNLPPLNKATSAPVVELPPLPSLSTSPKKLHPLPPLPSSPVFSPPSPSSSVANVAMPLNVSPIALPETPVFSLPPLNLPKKSPRKSPQKSPKKIKEVPGEVAGMPVYRIPSLEETLKHTRQPARKEKLQRMIETGRETEGRGSRTRGWAARAPQKFRERHELKAKCGDKCFLLPGEEKFPICPSPRMTDNPCVVDCQGVLAAKVRARQWGYEDVAVKAEQLLKECEAAVSPRGGSSPSPRLSPGMKAAGKIEYERKPEDYGVVRRQARRAMLASPTRYEWDHHDHHDHRDHHQDWDHHHKYMLGRYNWDHARWNDYKDRLQKMDWSRDGAWKDHKQHMQIKYGFDDKDWKDYKRQIKRYDWSEHHKSPGSQGLLSPSMATFGKHEGCGCDGSQ